MSNMKQCLIKAIAFAALGAAICCAQVATGNIRGTVSDSTGGVLPNCSVTITHTDTGLVRKVFTNEQGISMRRPFRSASTKSPLD